MRLILTRAPDRSDGAGGGGRPGAARGPGGGPRPPGAALDDAAIAYLVMSPLAGGTVPLPWSGEGGYEENVLLASVAGGVVRHVRDVDAAAPLVASPADEAGTCVICMESFADVLSAPGAPGAPAFRTTACEHTFCRACIERWLSDSVSCPVCMRDLGAYGGVSLRDEGGLFFAVPPPPRFRRPGGAPVPAASGAGPRPEAAGPCPHLLSAARHAGSILGILREAAARRRGGPPGN